ncbi:hypothetical protein ANN_11716, partial [Periplaneta americana]
STAAEVETKASNEFHKEEEDTREGGMEAHVLARTFGAAGKKLYGLRATTVTNINDTREEIKHRINSGNACYYSVEKLLSSSLLSKNLNVRIYKTVILPVILYGCETWTLTLREEHRLRVFENKVLRKIFGAKRDEVTGEWRKLHNTELHALYSSADIIRNIKSRRLRWAGHVARMGESRNAYRVLVGRQEGKRPLGRPRRRWEDNIKMDLREVRYDDRDWINLAQDRDQWRAYVTAAMNLRFPLSHFIKINILNQYIWPQLVYPFQCAPLKDLKVTFLTDIDKLILSAVKEIINIPTDTPDAMIYAPRRLRGLGVFKAQWEAYLQHLNICQRLLLVDNTHVAATRNLPNEIEHCIKQLPITFDCSERISSQKLRKALREDSFHQWSKLKSKGLGVVFYSHWKRGNSWISIKKGLSSSQWTQAIKMNCNTMPVRTLPGRNLDSTRCRRCDEQETLPHFLGFCHHGELLRINRHNTVRSLITASIRQNASYEVYEEVGCVSSDGSTRRADIIIIDRQKDKSVILDPTIRFEMHEQQPQKVCREKQVI